MTEFSIHIQQNHRHIWLIMTDERKIIVIHKMVTGKRKVIILITSSGTKKLIPVILCLMADQTVSLKITNMKM